MNDTHTRYKRESEHDGDKETCIILLPELNIPSLISSLTIYKISIKLALHSFFSTFNTHKVYLYLH